jgi:ketosteroid isomerase-like protein
MLQFGPKLEDLLVNLAGVEPCGDGVLALGTVFDRRLGESFATRAGWVFELDDGLVSRVRAFSTWGDARAAAGGVKP